MPESREFVDDCDYETHCSGCTPRIRNYVAEPSSSAYEQKLHCVDLDNHKEERFCAPLIFEGYAVYSTDSDDDGGDIDGGGTVNVEGEDKIAVTNYEGDEEVFEGADTEKEDEDDDVTLSAYFGGRVSELHDDMAVDVPHSIAEAEDAAACQVEKVCSSYFTPLRLIGSPVMIQKILLKIQTGSHMFLIEVVVVLVVI